MTAVSRFRIFGRPAPPPYPAPAPGWPPEDPAAAWPPPPAGVAAYAPPGYDPAAPAAAAYPPPAPAAHWPAPAWPTATWAAAPTGPGPAPAADPPTDPFGFPPIPTRASGAPDPAEAASLAGAFAVDYLSWDEDDPGRRGRVLLDYLPTPGSDPARLGWSGSGRQRAEFALPGLVRADGEGRVLVDVRVRVTPYRSVGEHGPDPAPEPDPEVAGIPAVAPAPTGRGWRSLASYWIRISVPVAVEGGRLVVDAWEETLGEQPAPVAPVPRSAEDHSLADDDPLAAPGSAW